MRSKNTSKFVGIRNKQQKKRIELTTPTPYSPESNGVAKRMNQTLMDKVCAIWKDTRMPWRYLKEVFDHATNFHNCAVSNALKNIPPHQSLLRITTDNSRLRTFGCAAYVHVDKAARRFNLADRTQLGIYSSTLN